MTPVCPACRAQIPLGSHMCPRCGLAMRPSCANCGEPLVVRMVECWRCREPIVPVVAAVPVAARPPAPVMSRGRTHHRHHLPVWRVAFEGILAASLLAVGMLSLEAFAPRYTSTSPAASVLDRRAFVDLGFSIAFPSGWRVKETSRGVSFKSDEVAGDVSTRGFSVAPVDVAFKRIKSEAEELDRRRLVGHEVVDTGRGRRAESRAYKRVLVAQDLRIDQWWIDRGSKLDPLRLEFWSRAADDDAQDINSRIVDTLVLS